jgi:hypothetical protein
MTKREQRGRVMDELERKAKHCMTHHHACDCREWHHQQQLSICDRRIEAHTSYINELETELAAVKKIVREIGRVIEYGVNSGDDAQDFWDNYPIVKAKEILNRPEVQEIMKERSDG